MFKEEQAYSSQLVQARDRAELISILWFLWPYRFTPGCFYFGRVAMAEIDQLLLGYLIRWPIEPYGEDRGEQRANTSRRSAHGVGICLEGFLSERDGTLKEAGSLFFISKHPRPSGIIGKLLQANRILSSIRFK